MPPNLLKFLGNLIDSGLLSRDEIDAFLRSLPAERRPQDGEQLAKVLVRHRKLTLFQAQQVYQGKGGSLVLGNYIILDKIGQGGMGAVYKAHHRRMDRTVALKVVSPDVINTDDLLQRFHREVRAAARLNHVNIVTAYDADEVKGTHFLVLEYVDGRDLANIVKSQGPLKVEQAVECILQAARGLHYAHGHGIIHRDIKPGNLLLDSSGTIKVLDMGLARFEEAGDVSSFDLTGTGTVMGTVDYMAPEQAVSTHDADARSDIYSLGITLWFLLTGHPAYEGKSLMARLIAHREQPVPSLAHHLEGIPPALDAVFRKMVAKKKADRYQSMDEVIAALQAVLRGDAGPCATSTFAQEDARLNEFLGVLNSGQHAAVGEPIPDFVLGSGGPPPVGAAEPTFFFGAPESDTDRTAGLPSPSSSTSGSLSREFPKKRSFRLKSPAVFGGVAAGVLLLAVLAGTLLFPSAEPTASVIVRTSQPELVGANILIDGRPRASVRSPENVGPMTFAADGKRHELKVTKTGFKTFTRGLSLSAGESIPIDVWLEPLPRSAPSARSASQLIQDVDWLLRNGAILHVLGPEGLIPVHDFIEYDRKKLPIFSVAFKPNWHVSDEALKHLEQLSSLENLDLRGAAVTGAGMRSLPHLTALRTLDLSGTAITDAGLAPLASCRQLEALSLAGTHVTDRGMPTLGAVVHLQQLTLDDTAVSDAGIASLAGCSQLSFLSLNGCPKATEKVGKSLQGVRQLSQLFVGNVSISDETIHDLADLDLVQLAIPNTPITDAAALPLAGMNRLNYLSISGTGLTEAAVVQLANALAGCHLETDYGTFTVPRGAVAARTTPSTGRSARPQQQPAGPAQAASGFFSLRAVGVNSFLEVADWTYDGAPVTMEAWVTPAESGGEPQDLITWLGPRWISIWRGGDRWGISTAGDGGTVVETSPAPVVAGKKVHVAGTFNGRQLQFFVDGRPVELTAVSANFGPAGAGLYIGGVRPGKPPYEGNRDFSGQVHEVRISRGIVYAESFAPTPGFQKNSSTIGLYRFDGLLSTVVTDQSGQGHDGTIIPRK